MRGLVASLLLALVAPLSGCAECTLQLDVRRCADRCDYEDGDLLREWTPAFAIFPDLERLLDTTAVGEHQHAGWTQNQADAFWAFLQVPADAPDRQVFLQKDGATFRVRVLAC